MNWNPLDTGAFATGTQGLIYEPLYLYDPVKGAYDPWLATGAEASGWQGSKYVINVRSGVTWSDGQPMTAADVAYSINLARTNAADPYSANVATVANATASGNTVTVTFKGTPGYTEFTDYLWKAPVLPQHIWSKISASQIATDANTHPVGTGPMTLDTANTQEVAYQTKPDWWGTSALGLSFKFKYLVDVVNGSNSQELGQLNSGNIDWSNNYLPGINMLATAQGGNGGYTLKFYYPKTPYMLSGNTVWLEPNTTKAPMNNVNFRKALAYALNPQAIAQSVYGGIASPATPTGLLPTLNSAGFVDQAVEQAERRHLQPVDGQVAAGEVRLRRADPHARGPAGLVRLEHRAAGDPAGAGRGRHQDPGHHAVGRTSAPLTSPTATTTWRSTTTLAWTPPRGPTSSASTSFRSRRSSPPSRTGSGTARRPTGTWCSRRRPPRRPTRAQLNQIYSTLEKDFLQQQPEIPLWYNGIWFQGNTQYWSNFPSSTGSRPEHPGHVERLHRRHDHGPRPGAADADPQKTS